MSDSPLVSALKAESASPFSHIPIMSAFVSLVGSELTLLSLLSDLQHLRSPDPELRQTLVRAVRDACMSVGFFYGIATGSMIDASRLTMNDENNLQ
jgi:hypothetical protein